MKIREKMLDREQGKKLIEERVRLFRTNIDQYKLPDYKEERVMKEFIDRFFLALGWDINNDQGLSERYKEVINQDAIKIGSTTKAPDYAFRIGGQRIFFVEAKKPSIKIKEDQEAAYQLRHYAWNSKIPISILTDFEEFAVYDCRIKPNIKDDASVARIMLIRFEDYSKDFDKIYDVFSKEAVRIRC